MITSIVSTEFSPWTESRAVSLRPCRDGDPFDIEIAPDRPRQTIDGFGGCFSELGWDALKALDAAGRAEAMRALFGADGCRFTLCRVPVGANDFASEWHSCNEAAGDFAMANFSIGRDRDRLIPFIRAALAHQPDLRIWASPWSPPTWMKRNAHYACRRSEFNDLGPDCPATHDGDTMFILTPEMQRAYALYLAKFIEAYAAEGIVVSALHPQNEMHSCQPFPSCLWKGPDLKNFIRDYLGPAFRGRGLTTEIWYGTFERPCEGEWAKEIDGVLNDPEAMAYIRGFGFQWAGKGAIGEVHRRRPDLRLMQTEMECGDGANTWERAEVVYDLLRHYFDAGAGAQMHWNMVLSETPTSPWGWRQNSMLTIDTGTKEIRCNPEFYVMKHIAHFVRPGAKVLDIAGARTTELAFRNSDGEIVLSGRNGADEKRELNVKIGRMLATCEWPGRSINTVVIRENP